MDQYGVIGQPISHSLSPFIHQQFARQTGQNLSYGALEVSPEQLPAFLADTELKGINVTLPHKQAVFELMHEVSQRATLAGAVNTISRDSKGRLSGDNTDGAGLIADLSRRLQLPLAGQRLLLLGAGGAARGIAGPLMDQGPAELMIVNRTVSRAQALAELTGASAGGWCSLDQLQPFDGIIHSTAAGHQKMPDLPMSLAGSDTWCYDLSYGSAAAPFINWAQENRCRSFDGLGMLVEQAALSFMIWRRVEVDTAPVLSDLRQKVSN